MTKGRLFLIPVTLGPSTADTVLPPPVCETARRLQHFVAENAKSARAFLKSLPSTTPLQQIDIKELNEHTPADALAGMLAPLLAGSDVGLVSEAGCLAVANPGALLVALAHENGIKVVPLIGPSSILLAPMASGLSGQNFAFHGYLPAKDEARQARIRELKRDSHLGKRTQIFIETPYRNRQMLETLIKTCGAGTRICVATDLTVETESVVTARAVDWRRRALPDIDRHPTVFLLQA